MTSLHLLLVAVSTIASQQQQPDEMPWLSYVCARPVSEGPGQVHFESAKSLEMRGDYNNALAAFLKAASSGEQWPYCLYVARIYLRLNEPGAAEDTATACSKLAPDCPAAQLTLAYVLGEKGEHARSEKIAESIIESDPKNAEAWYVSGRNRLAINDETQGEARLRKAIELNPDSPTPTWYLGHTTVKRNPLLNGVGVPWRELKLWDWGTSSSICIWGLFT